MVGRRNDMKARDIADKLAKEYKLTGREQK